MSRLLNVMALQPFLFERGTIIGNEKIETAPPIEELPATSRLAGVMSPDTPMDVENVRLTDDVFSAGWKRLTRKRKRPSGSDN